MSERLRINGREVELEAPTPLLAYLAELGVDWRAVAVEVNDRILDRAEYASATLRAGDVVEVVKMVGGGRPQVAPDAPDAPHGRMRRTGGRPNRQG